MAETPIDFDQLAALKPDDLKLRFNENPILLREFSVEAQKRAIIGDSSLLHVIIDLPLGVNEIVGGTEAGQGSLFFLNTCNLLEAIGEGE